MHTVLYGCVCLVNPRIAWNFSNGRADLNSDLAMRR